VYELDVCNSISDWGVDNFSSPPLPMNTLGGFLMFIRIFDETFSTTWVYSVELDDDCEW
jgi:hypothetical protein